MGKNILLNTLYTVGIFVGIIIGYQYGIQKGEYLYLAGAIVLIAIFMILKIRLIKEVKKTIKKN